MGVSQRHPLLACARRGTRLPGDESESTGTGTLGAVADETAPIQLLTADVTLGELTEGPGQGAAEDELARTAHAAARLGAAAIRVLAESAPSDPRRISIPRLPDAEITLLIEPHNRWWWTPVGTGLLAEMAEGEGRISLLADTAQAAVGLASLDDDTAEVIAADVIARSRVVHLSDDGSGFNAPGHGLLATRAWKAQEAGQEIEVAFEWTGVQRTMPVCLSRYHAACAWWLAQDETYLRSGRK